MPGTRKVSPGDRHKRYFYLDGKLYKHVRIDRHADYMYCQLVEDKSIVGFPYSYVKKNRQGAFTLRQAAAMLNRTKYTLQKHIFVGNIRKPGMVGKNPDVPLSGRFMLSEDDVLDMYELLCTKSIGRPNKKGLPGTPMALPTKSELRAMMRDELVTYVKNKDGEYVRTWEENDW